MRSMRRLGLRRAAHGSCRPRAAAKWLTTTAFVVALAGVSSEHERLLDTTDQGDVGYEARRWAIGCRQGRITLYSWYKAVSFRDLEKTPGPVSVADDEAWVAAVDAWVAALPERPTGQGWYRVPRNFIQPDPVVFCYFAEEPGGGSRGLGTQVWDSAILERGSVRVADLAFGAVALLGAATAFLWVRAWVRAWRWKRRTSGGHIPLPCVCCGYDLTGNVSGTCPECGSPAEPI